MIAHSLPSIDCLFISALREEIAPLEAEIAAFETNASRPSLRHYNCNGISVGIVVSGVGGVAAIRALEQLLKALHPRVAIIAGWAGSLTPQLSIHQLVLLTRIHHETLSDSRELLSLLWMQRILDCLPTSFEIETCEGITTDHIVCRRTEKEHLYHHYGASIVEMETYYIAQLLSHTSIPVVAIRVVSDAADESIGLELDKIPRNKLLRTAYFASHPTEYHRLIALKKMLGQSAKTLCKCLLVLIQSDRFRYLIAPDHHDERR